MDRVRTKAMGGVSSLHERARTLAHREGISINQLIATALAEKISALLTEEYFRERGREASHAKFVAALAKVSDIEPEDHDKLNCARKTGKRGARRGPRKKRRSRVSGGKNR
jgi:hypothetical protein